MYEYCRIQRARGVARTCMHAPGPQSCRRAAWCVSDVISTASTTSGCPTVQWPAVAASSIARGTLEGYCTGQLKLSPREARVSAIILLDSSFETSHCGSKVLHVSVAFGANVQKPLPASATLLDPSDPTVYTATVQVRWVGMGIRTQPHMSINSSASTMANKEILSYGRSDTPNHQLKTLALMQTTTVQPTPEDSPGNAIV